MSWVPMIKTKVTESDLHHTVTDNTFLLLDNVNFWQQYFITSVKNMDLTWEEAEELMNDKAQWRRRVAQCSHLDAGWTKV